MYFYLIIALQGFCIYHLYKNRNDTYWYFIILLIPLFGSVVYLITQVYSKRDVETIQNEITTIINPTKKVRDLEKAVEFADTFLNRVNLADAHLENKDYASAVKHYNKVLNEHADSDLHVHQKLIECYHALKAHDKLIPHAEKIKDTLEFKQSKSQFFYGLALDKIGMPDEAERVMRHIDQRYSHYDERVILAKFLMHRDKKEEAREILDAILTESEHMVKMNKKRYKLAIVEATRLHGELR